MVTWTHELRHNVIAKGIWGKGKHLTFSMTGKQRKKEVRTLKDTIFDTDGYSA